MKIPPVHNATPTSPKKRKKTVRVPKNHIPDAGKKVDTGTRSTPKHRNLGSHVDIFV